MVLSYHHCFCSFANTQTNSSKWRNFSFFQVSKMNNFGSLKRRQTNISCSFSRKLFIFFEIFSSPNKLFCRLFDHPSSFLNCSDNYSVCKINSRFSLTRQSVATRQAGRAPLLAKTGRETSSRARGTSIHPIPTSTTKAFRYWIGDRCAAVRQRVGQMPRSQPSWLCAIHWTGHLGTQPAHPRQAASRTRAARLLGRVQFTWRGLTILFCFVTAWGSPRRSSLATRWVLNSNHLQTITLQSSSPKKRSLALPQPSSLALKLQECHFPVGH